MKRILIIAAALFAFLSPAIAADSSVPAMGNATSVAGTDNFYCIQGAGTTEHQCTSAQFAAYVYSLASGDCTSSGVGAVTCTKTNGSAFTALATTAPGTSVATALGINVGTAGAFVVNGGALGTPSSGTLTNATGLPIAGLTGLGIGVSTLLAGTSSGTSGLAGTASPAFTGTPTAPTATVGTNTTQLATTAFVIANAGSGAVSSVTAGCGLTITPTTGAVVASVNVTTTNNTGTTDTITSTQCGTIITENNAASVAVAITTAGFATGNYFTVKNLGAGVATYTPSSGTIDGAATLVCLQNQSADLYFDGTNYKTLASSCRLDVSGTSGALGVSAIASGACATVVTVSAPGVATTDTVMFGYNGDPTAVAGYGASATGAVLTVYPYPTANNVNVKVCNSTGSSITPGAMTLNWRVTR